MAEWKRVPSGVVEFCYITKLGVFTVSLTPFDSDWYMSVWGMNEIYKISNSTDEQAKSSALSWARGVLGAALVDAGAEVNTCFACSVCKAEGAAIGLPCWVNNCDGVIRKFKTVTVQIVE